MTLNMIAMNCRFSAVGIAHNEPSVGDGRIKRTKAI